MDLIVWQDSFSVGNAAIDAQHKRMISMINELNFAMLNEHGEKASEAAIDGLVDYMLTHFDTEEKYFDKYKYPGSDRHKKEHAGFVQKVVAFRHQYEKQQNTSLATELMSFMSHWLQTHIKKSDVKYADFIRQTELSESGFPHRKNDAI